MKNFSLIVPGGCDSKCNFCDYKMAQFLQKNEYLSRLYKFLYKDFAFYIPKDVKSISITGGEPTLSEIFKDILMVIKDSGNFDKIVLTSNGAKLSENLDFIANHINYLNISRHGIGNQKNIEIFKNKKIIRDDEICFVCNYLNKYGIDVTLNHVYTKNTDFGKCFLSYIEKYINYAKSLNISYVCFRYDHNENTISKSFFEKAIATQYKLVSSNKCPVCIVNTYLINGMFVSFKSSYKEPSKTINDVFEYIFHPTGLLTSDWEGKNIINKNIVQERILGSSCESHMFGRGPGCGSGSGSGCGSGSGGY